MSIQKVVGRVALLALAVVVTAPALASAYSIEGRSVLVRGPHGETLRVTPYGASIVRLQLARRGEAFFDDGRYEMVESHDMGGAFSASDNPSTLTLRMAGGDGVAVVINKKTLAASFLANGVSKPILQEKAAPVWSGSRIVRRFAFDRNEHFTGMGHSYFGRSQSVDLKGQALSRNYGPEHADQAPLLVPFFISSKGYGVFMNSTFKNFFNFGKDGRFEFGIDTLGFDGRMDYFFIAGGAPKAVLKHYIELTGKPRLPSKAMFGLALSDKSHDHTTATPSDEHWWKEKIAAHRAAGFPLDHVVNDNRWRAGGGQRCESYFDWDKGRYPDPAEYAAWLTAQGLVTTLDFNRCIARYSDGWQAGFNLPDPGGIDFKDSAPDLTNPAFRAWFWNIFYNKSFSPALKYPGDAMWIDEFDEMGVAPEKMILSNGLSSAEMRNDWFMLIAKSLVQQGWDKSDIEKRPYVWVRGMTAGAQRYATLWSGDIKPNFDEMKLQIRGMQLAGLSGFPFWGHDAGGFYDWATNTGPDAQVYEKWAMAFGAFAPIWKPHGAGPSRWPLDRSAEEQQVAHTFTQQRYELMPYLYSAAHEAASSGLPMARAMLLEYPENKEAWQYDLQYMWGPDLLVAPFTSADQRQDVWLPPGKWQNYWQPGELIEGGKVLALKPDANEIAIFVKAGAVIPKYKFALSTAFQDKTLLMLDIYRGADGQADLVEDDDKTEAFRKKNAMMTTRISYRDAGTQLHILGAQGSYAGAPSQRAYQVRLHGAAAGTCFTVNGAPVQAKAGANAQVTVIDVPAADIRADTVISACPH